LIEEENFRSKTFPVQRLLRIHAMQLTAGEREAAIANLRSGEAPGDFLFKASEAIAKGARLLKARLLVTSGQAAHL
jgi:hypothetical protein